MSKLKSFLFAGTEGWSRTALKLFWILVFAMPIGVVLLFVGLSFTDLPSVTELENPKNNEASPVLASDGSVLGRYFVENRVMVDFKDLGPHLEAALVSTEDERYYTHSGIDWQSLPRVVIKTAILGQQSSGGGSTITQQLAKLLFTEQVSANIVERGFQKLKEWIIAVRLERKYTKEEIIAMYLNRYDFINGAQGIRAAAENYFDGKRPSDLNVEEAAMLIGMLKNASLYNPLRFPDRTRNRRNQVLAQMVRNNRISRTEFDSLSALPLGIKFTRQRHDDGLAPYFRMVLAEEAKRILSQEPYLKSNGQPYDIYRDGLTFYTTIDPVMQQHAEEQAVAHMRQLQKQFFQHWKSLDPWTYTNPYSETEVRVDRRQESLQNAIRHSDRYQAYRNAILQPVLDAVGEKMDFRFSRNDREIERMMQEKEEPGAIDEAVRLNLISEDFADRHRKVMRLPEFAELERAWKELQRTVKTEFEKEVKMRVFTYDNDRMETDTLMTPLDSVRYHKMILQIGSMSVEPSTGYVRTWVGGSNFKWFQYDHVTTKRQVGSTFKPFIYAASIDLRGITPCQRVLDQPVTIAPGDGNFHLNKPWTPRNSNGAYSYADYTLYQGLKNSVNTISAYLMKELASTEPVRNMVANMGIPKEEIPDAPSIALGSVDLTVQQLTGAYTTFGNNGVFIRPVFLTRIEDRTGRVIYEYLPEEQPAISPQANYVMVNMLSRASVGNLGGVEGPVGGKTGTTNDQTDGWYMGITPELIVGTWVGGDDRWIRFRSLGLGAGSNMAKPFFRRFVRAAQEDETIGWDTSKDWIRPEGELGIEMNCDAYNGGNDDLLEDGQLLSDDPFGNSPDF
ncbi:penicillin-binding protein 1A [Lewinella marina]|uniref:Peptidoglycan glycosyltransferase n=1 Tax=Neolewinella marina TaxID=438751 RepID=A0A2G0CF48_9BACT|nr:transglycosylase domain-containing protein [Neolewinella marina]NJB85725.1 penicillin-binding protein 1A [Neolewinella marina]PHK98599.1 peptidoglycan glycosyltransferase [Neolewinella marina]